MGRRRDDSSGIEILFFILRASPWFVGPILAGVAYITLGWVFPSIWPPLPNGADVQKAGLAGTTLSTFALIAKPFAPYAGGFILLLWGLAEMLKFLDRLRLDQIDGIESIRNLSWQEFEKLLCEAYRRQGYLVEHSGQDTADGGVDIWLRKAAEITLVQCKHWKQRKVNVKTVRELLGVVHKERAQFGIVVTSGTFTPDAVEFARQSPIQLVNGDDLVRLIGSVKVASTSDQANSGTASRSESSRPNESRQSEFGSSAEKSPKCPTCAAPMQIRTAKRGANSGQQFYGCSKYPACKGTREIPAA